MNYTHLSPGERYQIQCMCAMHLPIPKIAQLLHRHRSTITREIARSGFAPASYCADAAQQQARTRQQGRLGNARRFDASQWALVTAYLHLDLSPQQAACRLKLECQLRISHTCIYNHLHRLGPAAPVLRCGQRRRKPHPGVGQLRARVGIEHRPAVVDARTRLGDWEGDTIASGGGALAGLVTLTERRSRYTLARHVPRRQAALVGQAIIEMLGAHAGHRHTLTLDNGKEFAEHGWVQRRLKTQVYFADPHSPWQRGLNENHNGLLRHYFAKASDLSLVGEQEVRDAVYRLNHRPRRSLGWKTPHEVFYGYEVLPLLSGGGALRC